MSGRNRREDIKHAKDMGIQENADTHHHKRPIRVVTTLEPKGLVGYTTF